MLYNHQFDEIVFQIVSKVFLIGIQFMSPKSPKLSLNYFSLENNSFPQNLFGKGGGVGGGETLVSGFMSPL